MGKSYYEAHVTMTGDRSTLKAATEGVGWRFSAIDGDANLGDGLKLYATRQMNSKIGDDAAISILSEAANFLSSSGATILREKVEVVIYDTRSSKVRACDDCASCQSARDVA